MDVTFDGPNKLIILGAITEFDVIDLYSAWKEWTKTDNNSKYLQAMRPTGGDPLVSGQTISGYFFLMNGWRIRPQEASHMLTVGGNLFVDGGGNPFVVTLGSYNVTIQMVASVNAVTTEVGSGLSTEEHDQLMTLPLNPLTLDSLVEDPITFIEALRLMMAVLFGSSAGGGTDTITFRDMDNLKNRITAVVDAYGNRLSVGIDGT
jgi:hypothetical protein